LPSGFGGTGPFLQRNGSFMTSQGFRVQSSSTSLQKRYGKRKMAYRATTLKATPRIQPAICPPVQLSSYREGALQCQLWLLLTIQMHLNAPPLHTITMVRIPDVTPKYSGIIPRPARRGSSRFRTPYFVIEKIMIPKQPAVAGATTHAAKICDTPFQPKLPTAAMPTPVTPVYNTMPAN
jgi:hypothetical protein